MNLYIYRIILFLELTPSDQLLYAPTKISNTYSFFLRVVSNTYSEGVVNCKHQGLREIRPADRAALSNPAAGAARYV
jgi:hypothetical protein